MWSYITVTAILSSALAMAVYTGMFKAISKGFDEDPASTALHSEDSRDKQTDTAQSIRDKNTKMMEDLRAKMERNKRN